MLDFILCYSPTLLALYFIKNETIKYIAAIFFLIAGTLVLDELALARHNELHNLHHDKHPL